MGSQRSSAQRLVILFALAAIVAAPGIARTESALAVKSDAFAADAAIPVRYTCSGANHSPALTWSGAPGTTGSFALVVEDPDAPSGTFIHWVAYNIPPGLTGLRENVPRTETLADGGAQGVNDLGQIGYYGPCPPSGRVHHYHFRLFALDSTLSLGAGADASAVRSAMNGHVLASGELVATYGR